MTAFLLRIWVLPVLHCGILFNFSPFNITAGFFLFKVLFLRTVKISRAINYMVHQQLWVIKHCFDLFVTKINLLFLCFFCTVLLSVGRVRESSANYDKLDHRVFSMYVGYCFQT